MNAPTPKILVLRHDPKVRRMLTLLLANAGYDVRSFDETAPALEAIAGECFDAAILDHHLPSLDGMTVAAVLHEAQPLAILMLFSEELELDAVVRSIRLGINDVFCQSDDFRPVLQRLNDLLHKKPVADEPSTAEIAHVDTMLASLEGTVPATSTAASREALERELGELKIICGDLIREKDQLEEQVKTLSTRAAGAVTGETDPKLQPAETAASEAGRLEKDRAALLQLRADLLKEETTIEARWTELSTAAQQLETGRRSLGESEEMLRTQEIQLRAYEERLREQQAQIEAARAAAAASRPPEQPQRDDAEFKAGWDKLNRAMQLFENERRNFIDEKNGLREERASLKLRETALAEKTAKLAEQEKRLTIINDKTLTRSPFDRVFRRAC